MRIASLGSGSKGNATLVSHEATTILIDCGFSLRQFELRLAKLDLGPEDIDAILVTHEHSDHGAGVERLASRYDISVWTTIGTARAVFDGGFTFHTISGGQSLQIGCFDIFPVTVPHDAGEPVQYVFRHISSGKRFGILTDTGHITTHITQAYDNLDGLLLEFNYDQAMLEKGPYPYPVKQRVASDLGHLSNEQSLGLLRQINTSGLNCLIAGHISAQNNCPDIVSQHLSQLENIPTPILADQESGFGWISV